ncbi:tyrosine-protein phosphatase non-receptor type 18-like isoform X1 [Oncorhynchus keta]|uniref:tyrosine-protein phosphatase non-receptor type 18-like isoform X1 n=1 Tax=Oncorhynchus keta TaxID=8018 RepID=UPI0015FC1A49|nr:tyrosine-protein phosphatase non-receptor type 18-like isoform X1 [Oncorhynchus keta]
MENLSRFVGQMSLADDSRAEGNISSEYINIRAQTSVIKKDVGLTTIAGELMENVKKNRYRDILPYDQTRVPLTLLTNENDLDYINASFIKGATKTKKYIATQGPLRHTLVDFWRMIWQYDVKVIIMACREIEMGKKKCECYWTTFKETTHFGPFIVSNFQESSPNEEVVFRALTVRYHEETRKISQFQYTAWPDHDVPYTVYGILGMMDMARKDQGNNTSPVLIHCSAGCGRTGVICALDYVHDLLVTKQIKEDFSIMKIVVELRSQRPSAVQTKEQYRFVFSAVASMFEKALRSAENNSQNLTKSNQSLYDGVASVKTSPPTTSASAQTLAERYSNVQYRAPRPRQQKMNDVYAVVNKSKQLPPPASSTVPLAALHHYDNEELGVPKCHVGALYSMVKPKSRCLPAKTPPAVSPIYDTAGLANHRLAEASAGEDQSGYELVAADRHSSTEDDYEYVSNPIKRMTNSCTPSSMEFNCRIKKPKGPRDPPAEWSRVER